MEKYIIIALILLFGVVYYFDKQSDAKLAALEQSSTLNIDKNKPKEKSFWKIISDHNKSKNYYKDRGITVKSSNKPNSDTSACVGVTKSDKDMIITKFAGYVLQYPCTVNQKGEYHIEYNSDGAILSQRHTLYLGLKMRKESDSTWQIGSRPIENNDVKGYFIKLSNNGDNVSFSQFYDRVNKAQFIKELVDKNYIVYANKNYVFAKQIKSLDYDDNSPHLSCDRYGDVDPFELFSPFHKIGRKSQCSLIWRLTPDIKVTVIRYQSKYAYNFLEIYNQINNALQKIIFEKPNNPLLKPKEI